MMFVKELKDNERRVNMELSKQAWELYINARALYDELSEKCDLGKIDQEIVDIAMDNEYAALELYHEISKL